MRSIFNSGHVHCRIACEGQYCIMDHHDNYSPLGAPLCREGHSSIWVCLYVSLSVCLHSSEGIGRDFLIHEFCIRPIYVLTAKC